MNKPLVTAQWLFENLNNPNLIILDASVKSVDGSSDAALKNIRIKQARYFDLKNSFSEKSAQFPNTFPSETQFEEECQELGINHESLIVVYDNLGIYSAPRAWWMLRTMGHQNVAVLDGGLPEWLAQNYPTEEITPVNYAKGNFKVKQEANGVKFYTDVKKNIDSQTAIIIDARSKGRFEGTSPEPREGLRSGSIPNSVNIPFGDVLNNGKYKSKAELSVIFDSLNLNNKEIIYSCGSGLTACIILLAGELVLNNKSAVYDGSWTEWAQTEQ